MKGLILYRGPSVLDGSPIICIATLSTANHKTGNMIQTWILREDVLPTVAVKTGQDSSVCGNCPQRHFVQGACYVMPFQAPSNVFRAYHRGAYEDLSTTNLYQLMGRKIRLGSYGDPAAVPYYVWLGVTSVSEGWTGYTHQMDHSCFDEKILEFCQASIESEAQYRVAVEKNWPTFRIRDPLRRALKGELICKTEISETNCLICGLCDGKSKNNIVIRVHGSRKSRFRSRY